MLMSYFELLNPKTGNILQYLLNWWCKSMSWFFLQLWNLLRHYQNHLRDSPLRWRFYGFDVDWDFGESVQIRFVLLFQIEASQFSFALHTVWQSFPEYQLKMTQSHNGLLCRGIWDPLKQDLVLKWKLNLVLRSVLYFLYLWFLHPPSILTRNQVYPYSWKVFVHQL